MGKKIRQNSSSERFNTLEIEATSSVFGRYFPVNIFEVLFLCQFIASLKIFCVLYLDAIAPLKAGMFMLHLLSPFGDKIISPNGEKVNIFGDVIVVLGDFKC